MARKTDEKEEPSAAEAPKQKTCFVVSPIGQDGSDHRTHANRLYKYVVTEVLEEEPYCYRCERADNISRSGAITTQIVEALLKSDLVIADLSFHNPNVFYELAIRHMTRKPFIHLISTADRIPFDVITDRAITFDLTNLDSVNAAKNELRRQVNEIESGTPTVSAFSEAIKLDALSQSGDPTHVLLGEVLAELRLSRQRSSVPVSPNWLIEAIYPAENQTHASSGPRLSRARVRNVRCILKDGLELKWDSAIYVFRTERKSAKLIVDHNPGEMSLDQHIEFTLSGQLIVGNITGIDDEGTLTVLHLDL